MQETEEIKDSKSTSKTPVHTFFLAGGYGDYTITENKTAATLLKKQLASADKNTTLLFTGDNISATTKNWNTDKELAAAWMAAFWALEWMEASRLPCARQYALAWLYVFTSVCTASGGGGGGDGAGGGEGGGEGGGVGPDPGGYGGGAGGAGGLGLGAYTTTSRRLRIRSYPGSLMVT